MDINFEYYKIFYFVAKYGNITKAAIALDSNQPNITRIIKLLESQLNCRLFIREARGIRLTEEGKTLYSHVEIAYSHLLNAQEEICRQDSQICGTVTIGATETALHLFLLNFLHSFKLEYPAVRVKIYNQSTPETFCKGLFNQVHRKFTFQGKKIEPKIYFQDSRLDILSITFLSNLINDSRIELSL